MIVSGLRLLVPERVDVSSAAAAAAAAVKPEPGRNCFTIAA